MQLLHRLQDSFIVLSLTALILLLITHLSCQRFFKQFPASPMSGSVIMALALYVAECLPQYQPNFWVLKLLMLEVTVIWIYGSFSLLHDFFLRESTGRQSDRFGLSAWIVSTTLVAIMINRITPLQHGVILLLVIFALLLWIKYAAMVCRALLFHVRNKFNEYVSASLLLGAAATACVAWMFYIIFQRIPTQAYQIFIMLACLLYIFIFAMWLSHYVRGKMHHLLASWNAENSLVFGVASVIGLVALLTQVPEWLIDALWYWSVIWCLVITMVDVAHGCVRLIKRGVHKKALVYDVRQWLRIFSYCMLYVFTWFYYFEHYSDDLFSSVIAEEGLNFITAIYLAQIIYICLAVWLAPHDEPSSIE